MTVFGLKWGQDFWEPGGTPRQEFRGVEPPDSIIGNYSKHPLIRTRGKSLVAEISRFDTQKYVYKNLFSQARSNNLIL